jgi:hypothetical protein
VAARECRIGAPCYDCVPAHPIAVAEVRATTGVLDTSTLGPICAIQAAQADWRVPFRSMDAQGGPETAGGRGWDWITAVGMRLRSQGRNVSVECGPARDTAGPFTMQLYEGTALIACATVFRDPMNFAVLVRWLAQGVEQHG